MATLPYSDRTDTYSTTTAIRDHDGYGESTAAGIGGKIFIWLAWALAAAFWGLTLTTAVGILNAMGHSAAEPPGPGEVDAGGIGWLLMNAVGGLVVLGLAIAYGLTRYATRDKRKDPVTEAATHALYDTIEQRGDEAISRSPEDREPEERDAYRAAQADLR